MKLFTKTLLFFISLIVFQSSLTILLITNITKRGNLEDAEKELKQEAASSVENYHSWKRGIWKSLNDIRNDPKLAEILRLPAETSVSKTLIAFLKERLFAAGIDTFVLQYASHNKTEIVPLTSNNFSFADVEAFENTRLHPYLELRLINTQLCLVGITRFPLQQGNTKKSEAYIDLFLLKRIDKDFCNQLVLNRNSHAAFFLDDRYVSGTLPEKPFCDIAGCMSFDTGSHEIYNIAIKKIGYNAAVQRIETISGADVTHKLFLVTLVSNAVYVKRVSILENTVLSVSVLSGLLTILLSLFFSGNMTRPIHQLLAAMQRIRSGRHTTMPAISSQNEIGTLIQGFNAMAEKIHEDKARMEEYIHEITVLKDYNEQIIQSIRSGMIILNHALEIEKVNSTFVDAFGLDESRIIGTGLRDLPLRIVDDDVVKNVQAILRNEQDEYTKITRSRRNHVYELKLYPIVSPEEPLPHSGNPVVGCILVVEDISRKIEFEEKIFQAEKLSSMSMLSAGVAHEINNPLSSIMTNVQNLLEEETDEDRGVSLKWIEQETRRIARIVKELLDFASSDFDKIQETDVNNVVGETIRLISYSLKKTQKIPITTDLEENMPSAMMSPDELKQILINLLKNAIQAVGEQGQICVHTRFNRDEQVVEVFVKDNGIGIREEDLPHIFDPFYTTKRNGEGTGLGLSVVYGLINKYNGSITVNSIKGKGTTIRCAIPVLTRL